MQHVKTKIKIKTVISRGAVTLQGTQAQSALFQSSDRESPYKPAQRMIWPGLHRLEESDCA